MPEERRRGNRPVGRGATAARAGRRVEQRAGEGQELLAPTALEGLLDEDGMDDAGAEDALGGLLQTLLDQRHVDGLLGPGILVVERVEIGDEGVAQLAL